jgi:hypothetical protein
MTDRLQKNERHVFAENPFGCHMDGVCQSSLLDMRMAYVDGVNLLGDPLCI